MARGGFIQPEVAIARLYKALGSRDAAKVGIYDALMSGALLARGRRILRCEWEPTPPGMLRDLATAEVTLVLGEPEDIPTKYWSGFLIIHVSDWECGHLRNPTWRDHHGYNDVMLKEKDVNSILTRLRPSSGKAERKEKRRDASWEEWVAAAIVIAEENRILPTMNAHQLISEINAKLQLWNLDPKEKNTVLKTARGIMEWYNNYPPVRPCAAILDRSKP
ncbi:MAG: hypothetical protein KBA57_07385 [Sphingomonadaceae bacterium]|nr:hypothetical protein [Sphingomonadaceae bacterium]